MREKPHRNLLGESLRVYPHAPKDAADDELRGLYVEAYLWKDATTKGAGSEWRVGIPTVSSSLEMTPEEAGELVRAIERARGWIEEQERK